MMKDYPVSSVTVFDESGEDPIYCAVCYGYTNAHWCLDEGDVILPTLPSASDLLIVVDYDRA